MLPQKGKRQDSPTQAQLDSLAADAAQEKPLFGMDADALAERMAAIVHQPRSTDNKYHNVKPSIS